MRDLENTIFNKPYKEIKEKSLPDFDYLLMLAISSIICFFGFRMNSAAVIIGGMVISPILYSVIGISAAIFFADLKQLVKEFVTLCIEITVILIIIIIFAKIFPIEISSEITSRINGLNIDYFIIAILSGIAGTFALFWPKTDKSLVGVAIAVALIPPIVLLGIGLSMFSTPIIIGATRIVIINLFGLFCGSLLLLLSLGLVRKSPFIK